MLIRGGTVVDGTGAPARRADVAIVNDHIVDIAPNIVGTASRVIDATDRVVTPGFVDIHTHLDAQLAWDPIGSSSCYHGITSVVMGNCGVTFAPCKPEDREYLAEMMESVEDIPRDAILDGLAWDWVTYGEYLASVGPHAQGPERRRHGGALRVASVRDGRARPRSGAADGRRSGDHGRSARRGDARRSAGLQHQPHVPAQGARRSPRAGHVRRARRSCSRSPTCSAATAPGSSRAPAASARAIATTPTCPSTRAEMAWMGEVSRRSGRPVSFGLLQHDSRPDLYARVIELAKDENALGANVRPQTTARSVGMLFSLDTRTPFDRARRVARSPGDAQRQEAGGAARPGDREPA